jgi:hypothetical protein
MAERKRSQDYDKTQAHRQRKRRALFTRMREALEKIQDAASLDEAKEIALKGRDESFPKEYED